MATPLPPVSVPTRRLERAGLESAWGGCVEFRRRDRKSGPGGPATPQSMLVWHWWSHDNVVRFVRRGHGRRLTSRGEAEVDMTRIKGPGRRLQNLESVHVEPRGAGKGRKGFRQYSISHHGDIISWHEHPHVTNRPVAVVGKGSSKGARPKRLLPGLDSAFA